LSTALKPSRRATFTERLAALGLGLERRLSDRMALLSGGQRQAIALVMATLAPSSVLLLDEHTAALDPGMAEFVTGLTRRIVEDHHLTTLMVTHSMRQALDLGTRTIMLHEGRIVLDVGGAERSSLTVEDLVAMFRRQRGIELDDDELLIG
jgi:putative ABC transport system ATP-binding protein